MAELSISPDVIRDALKDFVAAYEPTGAAATEVGTVIDAADGIAHVEGLPGVMANELVNFADGTQGLLMSWRKMITVTFLSTRHHVLLTPVCAVLMKIKLLR